MTRHREREDPVEVEDAVLLVALHRVHENVSPSLLPLIQPGKKKEAKGEGKLRATHECMMDTTLIIIGCGRAQGLKACTASPIQAYYKPHEALPPRRNPLFTPRAKGREAAQVPAACPQQL